MFKIERGQQYDLTIPHFILKVVAVLLLLHAILVFFYPDFLSVLDKKIVPILSFLKYFGLEITKPCLGGGFPDEFYVVHVGIALVGVVLSSISTIALKVIWKTHLSKGVEFGINACMTKYKCGFNSARWRVRFGIFVFFVFSCYLFLLIWNAVNGWWLFPCNGLHEMIFFPLAFIFPGAYWICVLIIMFEIIWSDILLGF